MIKELTNKLTVIYLYENRWWKPLEYHLERENHSEL